LQKYKEREQELKVQVIFVSHSYQTWFTWFSRNWCLCVWVAWPRDHEVRINNRLLHHCPINIYFDLVLYQTVLCFKLSINPPVIYIFKHQLMVLHNVFHYTINGNLNGFYYLKTPTPWFLLIENNNTMVSIQNKNNHMNFLFIWDN